ncbi:MAG: mandelate racemase/muconate lactonizing enzyme family protein [Saprospiraceae bacterium]|nr:mandelate racemase/muconate lactonizing enzyme family protein [Saprospiraceae bacterium]|tara:strand:+ start:5128 stop:6294 length:1167 start_codon:yes stop_codon:yes gene_type:complete
MKIADVAAHWISVPIPVKGQWRSDYGRLTHFDMCLVIIKTDDGRIGIGEAKSAVGATGSCASIVACIEHELKPIILGKPVHNISELWERMYNGSRDHYALSRGRSFPILGNRGTTISAMSGIDIALWDLKGQDLNTPVVNLLGGSCRSEMEAYASGGWADADEIGEQLKSYCSKGFKGVKMRVGSMDDTVPYSVRRVKEARSALGDGIKLMADAHGTFSVSEAKRFCRDVEDCNLYWMEEPISPDNKIGTAEVRACTQTPISAGESEFTRFDFVELINHRAVDVLQPDAAICGGITECMKVSALAGAYQLELAPHCWGSAISFMAGVNVAFASPSSVVIEFSLGGNPLMYDLCIEEPDVKEGIVKAPSRSGLGLSLNMDFVKEYSKKL